MLLKVSKGDPGWEGAPRWECGGIDRATLAEKEVNSLKEKLSTTTTTTTTTSGGCPDETGMDVTAPPSLSLPLPLAMPVATTTSPTPTSSPPSMMVEQNGVAPPSPSTTPGSESGSIGVVHRPEVALSPCEKQAGGARSPTDVSVHTSDDASSGQVTEGSHHETGKDADSERHDREGIELVNNLSKSKSSEMETEGKGEQKHCNESGASTKEPVLEGRTRTMAEELSAKDREPSTETCFGQ
uniref:Uncharacterized protein n=1 Tax=Anopheles atroparvus TaxID=41427 RepID=A0A182JEP9_ANOAO